MHPSGNPANGGQFYYESDAKPVENNHPYGESPYTTPFTECDPNSSSTLRYSEGENQAYYYGGSAVIPKQEANSSPLPTNQESNTSSLIQSPIALESDLAQSKPQSPVILFSGAITATGGHQTLSLPVSNVACEIEIHGSTAFIRQTITFINSAGKNIDGLFAMPSDGTVTHCEVSLNQERFLQTTYVDSKKTGRLISKKETNTDNPLSRFLPGIFRLPLTNIPEGYHVTVTIESIETLLFSDGHFHLVLPLKFHNGTLIKGAPITLKCAINSVTPGLLYGSTSHQLFLVSNQNLRTLLYAAPQPSSSDFSSNSSGSDSELSRFISRDLHIAYRIQTDRITCSVLTDQVEPSFLCVINPPPLPSNNLTKVSESIPSFGRDIIFLVDRSGSMSGAPMKNAQTALLKALDSLTIADTFNIVAFDHEQLSFNPNQPLVPAQPECIDRAKQFVINTPVRGATDIHAPLKQALETLQNAQQWLRNQQAPPRLPFVVLITDGAVPGERAIVNNLKELCKGIRVLTFGVGLHCNWYFLRILSMISRGWSSGAVSSEQVTPRLTALIQKSQSPVLSDVQIQVEGVSGLTLVPQTIPDVFAGNPITMAGRFEKGSIRKVIISATTVTGSQFRVEVDPQPGSQTVPVSRVFVKSLMDQLTAHHWLTGDPSLQKRIIDLSVTESVPSPHTSLVAYELTPKEKAELDRQKSNGKTQDSSVASKRKGLSGKQVAGLAGGAIVVGAGLLIAGSVAATVAGGGGFAEGLGSVGQSLEGLVEGCPCNACCAAVSCGNLDCDSCLSGLSCGACESCGSALPCSNLECGDLPCCDLCGGLINSVGGIAGDGCDAIGDCCQNVCGPLSGALAAIANTCLSCELCGECLNLCGQCGGILGVCGDLCGSCGGILGGLLNGLDGCVDLIGVLLR